MSDAGVCKAPAAGCANSSSRGPCLPQVWLAVHLPSVLLRQRPPGATYSASQAPVVALQLLDSSQGPLAVHTTPAHRSAVSRPAAAHQQGKGSSA